MIYSLMCYTSKGTWQGFHIQEMIEKAINYVTYFTFS